MAKMPGLLRQRQKIDEAELERDQTRVAARLADIFGGSAASAPDNPSQADAPAEATSAGLATSTAEPPAADGGVRGKRRGRSRPAIVVELGPVGVADPTETDASGDDAANHDGVPEPAGTPMVGVMAGPGSTVAAGPGAEWWSAAVDYALIGNAGKADMDGSADTDDAARAAGGIDAAEMADAVATAATADAPTPGPEDAVSAAPAADASDRDVAASLPSAPTPSEADGAPAPARALAIDAVDARPAAPPDDPATPANSGAASQPAKREPATRRPPAPRPRTKVQPGATRPRSASTRRARPGKGATKPVAVAVSCPYCAVLLEPPPTSSRSCPRCRNRIVVKRIEGRAVYLTEAAVAFFEAERRRIAGAARFTRERGRWLKLAAAAGAPPERAARLVAAQLSEETVDAARTLYMNTVERAFRSAKRERRWEDASRIRREQAMALFRLARSGSIPPEAVVTLHREGVAAELRGIAAIAKEAELVSAACCDICRAEDGRIGRITHELLAPRLPHAGCPKGLCRCRWDLTARDRTILLRYQRRPARASQRAVPAVPQPAV